MLSFGKWLLLGILAIVTIYFSVNHQTAPFVSDLTLQKVFAALGGIFIIILLVERVTEVVISVWRGAPTDQLEKELAALTGDPAKVAEATDKAKELSRYQSETKGFALFVGFTVSVVVCAAGVGLLGEIINIPERSPYFLRGVDIILTSGLIAGGSDAFHQFVRAVETFFTRHKEKMQNS